MSGNVNVDTQLRIRKLFASVISKDINLVSLHCFCGFYVFILFIYKFLICMVKGGGLTLDFRSYENCNN